MSNFTGNNKLLFENFSNCFGECDELDRRHAEIFFGLFVLLFPEIVFDFSKMLSDFVSTFCPICFRHCVWLFPMTCPICFRHFAWRFSDMLSAFLFWHAVLLFSKSCPLFWFKSLLGRCRTFSWSCRSFGDMSNFFRGHVKLFRGLVLKSGLLGNS